MKNINQFDELGRAQGLWICKLKTNLAGYDVLTHRRYYVNNRIVNYYLISMKNKFYKDSFHNPLF